MNSIKERVKRAVITVLSLDEGMVTDDAFFVEDLGADSLAILELMLALQQEFECDIPDEEARRITSVGQAVTYLESRV